MSDFRTRLDNEKEELEIKLSGLDGFLGTDNFHALPRVQKSLLRIQARAMRTYYDCLCERIMDLDEPVEVLFTQNQIDSLQTDVHKVTGDGDAMIPFNKLLGICGGSGE